MTSARVISVNAGRGKDADRAGKLGRTAIDKRPVPGRVEVGMLGLGGDEQVDKPAHGGPEQAVYAYASRSQRSAREGAHEMRGSRARPATRR